MNKLEHISCKALKETHKETEFRENQPECNKFNFKDQKEKRTPVLAINTT